VSHARKLFAALLALAILPEARAEADSPSGYNGIASPEEWPPQFEITRTPPAVPPYVSSPPAVIPIDLGRQLFVDDFLIEATTLTRVQHRPEYSSANPVLAPERPWEKEHAAMFSDGVWFDAADGLFKMWYWAAGIVEGQRRGSTCQALSRDGIHWEKPNLDVVPDTNIVLLDEPGHPRNSSTVWLDHEEADPARRFKMFRNISSQKTGDDPGGWRLRASFSPDGIHWTTAGDSDHDNDRTTVFYNPFRKVWVASLRAGGKEKERIRGYYENRDPLAVLHWRTPDGRRRDVHWIGADTLDPARNDLALQHSPDRPFDDTPSQLYNLDCVAYESVMLGLFSIWRGQQVKLPKINEVCVGFSRDGFHWWRPDRRPFCPVAANEPVWNSGNLQSAGGCCLVVGDKLYFYVGAVPGHNAFADPGNVGLAILRRDGFTSLDAGESPGIVTTRPVSFHGSRLFVNVASPQGELRAEVLDPGGRIIAPFSLENCEPVSADRTLQAISWRGAPDLSALRGKPVKFCFHLTHGQLYSFWVSPEKSGASHGYVAAGGPSLSGDRDQPESAGK
jgi:hypothetical protein